MPEAVVTPDQWRSIPLPIRNQGLIIFTTKPNILYLDHFKSRPLTKLVFQVSPTTTKERRRKKKDDETPNEYLSLKIVEGEAMFCMKFEGTEESVLCRKPNNSSSENQPGISHSTTLSYWYSYDGTECVLKYGKGYAMEETTIMTYGFLDKCKTEKEKTQKRKEIDIFFNVNSDKYLTMHLGYFKDHRRRGVGGLVDAERTLQFRPDPFTCNFSPIVLDSSKVTLFDLDRGEYMFSSSLPAACRELYENIKGLSLQNEESNPVMKLSDALRYSIETPKCLLYETLEKKENEFGPESPKNMTYLRVTLGPRRRTAPGIPYVLEIWPSGHCSPIHNHASASAIIKVLFGKINVTVYNKFAELNGTDEHPQMLKSFDGKEGDVTWIDKDWFQTHKLQNRTDDFCATIQCYRYEDADAIHYPGFDYIRPSSDSALEVFYPNSDFTFEELRSAVLKEYKRYLEEKDPLPGNSKEVIVA